MLPILLGVMVGAPLVAREYEQRTRLLVWMQSVTRTRWLIVTLALVLGAGLLASAVLFALMNWWYHPFDLLIGKFNQATFDFTGPVFLASSLMALAVGIAAGTLTRRTILAIFVTIALLVGIRIIVEFNLRPNYQPQVIVTWPLTQGNDLSLGQDHPPITLGREDWQIGSGFIWMLRGTGPTASAATPPPHRPLYNAPRTMGTAATTSPTNPRTGSGPSSGSRRASTWPSPSWRWGDRVVGAAAPRLMRNTS